jgi:hypothetical protein
MIRSLFALLYYDNMSAGQITSYSDGRWIAEPSDGIAVPLLQKIGHFMLGFLFQFTPIVSHL